MNVRIREKTAIFALDDEDREIWVRLAKLVEELAVEGVVNGLPERATTIQDRVYVRGTQGAGGGRRCQHLNSGHRK